MELLDALSWRYATKRMNGQKVPEDKLNTILEAIRLAASSFGLQPYRVVVVDDPELKAKIYGSACPQLPILEGSHVLVFASWRNITNEQTDRYVSLIAKERNLPIEKLAKLDKSLKDFISTRTPKQLANWAARQAYIGLGFGLTAAALQEVDATPMEGFTPAEMDKVLGLEEQNLHSVALLTLGYRDEEKDHLVKQKKVRVRTEEFFIHNRL